MNTEPRLWDGHWIVRRPAGPARPSAGDAGDASENPYTAILGLDQLPPAAQPPVIALVGDLARPVDAQVALPLPAGGHALLTVRGDPAHVEILIQGAGERPDVHPGDPLVVVLGDGRRAALDGVAACVIDPDGTTSGVSPALSEIAGGPARRLTSEGLLSIIGADDRERVTAVMNSESDSADIVRLEPLDGGPERWVTVRGVELHGGPDGRGVTTLIGDTSFGGRLLLIQELHPRSSDLARAAHRARAAFLHAPTGRARIGSDGSIDAANPALASLLETEIEDLVGRMLVTLIAPADRPAFESLLGAVLRGDLSGFEHEVRLAPPPSTTRVDDGFSFLGLDAAPATADDNGDDAVADRPSPTPAPEPGGDVEAEVPARWMRVQVDAVALATTDIEADVEVHDVTTRRQTQRDTRDTVSALRAAFLHAPTPMAVIALDGTIREANAELHALLDLGSDEESPRRLTDLAPDEDRGLIEGVLAEIATGGRARVECRLRRRDGSDGLVEVAASAVTAEDHPNPFAVAQVTDITARRDTEEKLLHQTLHDPLTGLGNRLLLRERLERATAARAQAPFALMFIDLDHFKSTNDTHGHEVGDVVLVEVARRLRSVVRGDDTVARLGGDEFVVLAAGVTDEAGAEVLASKVRSTITEAMSAGERTLRITASVGVVLPGAEHVTADALLRDADASMYRAKSSGRDRYEITVGTPPRTATGPVIEALRLALDTDGLQIHHQPVVDLRTGRAVGTEALLRVVDPVEGIHPPGRLLDGVDDSELLVDLAGWVLDGMLDQMREWDEAGVGPLSVWLNLSGPELRTDNLLERVSSALTRTGVDPERIHLEIPEPALLLADNAALERLRTLSALGLRLGIDDFGTGTTSLAHLRSLPVHFLKIDPSIGRRLREPGGRAVVEAVVAVGRALGLDVIAEGIESRQQMEDLAQLGCTHAQGNLFAPPGPAESLSLANETF